MRSRAYRPDVPICLEERSLLSVAAGHSGDPYVFSRRQFNLFAAHVRSGFDLFIRHRDVSEVHDEIDDVIVWIPFQRVDGLDASINRIVDRMPQELSAHVPNAVQSAFKDVIAVAHADVQARVRAGDVIVR
jgi:hypothetical protein